jgi:indolepyruvate ferredoxin oxidoreductase
MVGVAHQAGALPIDARSIEEAIRQTGISVEMSVLAFRWGRMAVINPAFVRAEVSRLAGASAPAISPLSEEARQIVESIGASGELHRLVTIRVAELIAYQDAAYARRYAETVRHTVLTEQRKVPGKTEYSQAVARFLFKLMAYKDEFEVARLHSDPEFLRQLSLRFGPHYKVHYHLSPPTLSSKDRKTSAPRKRKFGRWIRYLFTVLASFRSLRGGLLDPFARTEERRRERALIEKYLVTIDQVSSAMSFANYAVAVQIAAIPDDIRGYGHVKMQSLRLAQEKESKLLQEYFSRSERSAA